MGIDATVEEASEERTEPVAASVTPHPGIQSAPYRLAVPTGEGFGIYTGYAQFPSVSYTTEPVYATKTVGGFGLRVTSAHKSSGGGIKFNNSSHGGGSKKSSGGGGGSKSTSHADTKSFSDKDRYHTIKNQIEDLSAGYDDINKAKDRAFGKERLKYMD
jgi:hypothetical protein